MQNANSIETDSAFQLLKIVTEHLPFPFFLKDENGVYFLINKLQAELLNLSESEIVGKTDEHFVQNPDELVIIKKTDEEVLSGKTIDLPNQSFTLANGITYVLKTQKLPFRNPVTGKTNILGFSIDVTDSEVLNKVKKIQILNSNPLL